MDVHLVARLLRLLLLGLGLVMMIGALDLRGPDPEVPRYVLDAPSEDEPELKGCGSFC